MCQLFFLVALILLHTIEMRTVRNNVFVTLMWISVVSITTAIAAVTSDTLTTV